MTSLFGSAIPASGFVSGDAGPLQLMVAVSMSAPSVITHVRYYVTSTSLATELSGTLPYQVWRTGEPLSAVTGNLTIPGALGWVDDELSTPLQVPTGRRVCVAVSMNPAVSLSAAETPYVFPRFNALITGHGSYFSFNSNTILVTNPDAGDHVFDRTNYYIDVEAAVSEMVNLAPGDMTVGDDITVRRNTSGTVTAITPITDALTVAVDVVGGPLDGTNVDVWIPDTAAGLAAADMKLLKELPDPGIGSEWQAQTFTGGDGSLWVYIGGGQYSCFQDGTSFQEGAKTTRADTPSLISWP